MLVNIAVKVKNHTFVRKKNGKIYNIGNKMGLCTGPVGDKYRVVIDGIDFFLYEDDFEKVNT